MSVPPQKIPRLAVVGGGISGLAAAYRLTQLLPESQVLLLEGSDRLGGVLYTHSGDSLLVERGADSFLNKLPCAIELCRELGIDDQLIPTNQQRRRALVVRDGRLHAVPDGFVVIRPHKLRPILESSLLSWRGKLRLLAEPWIPAHPEIDRPEYDESVASFASRRLGTESFQRLVQPLLAGIYTADPYKLSLAATMPDAIADERTHGSLYRAAQRRSGGQDQASSGARYGSFLTFRDGIEKLVQTLSSQLGEERIMRGCPIHRIEQTSEKLWQLHTDGEQLGLFDGVVLAVPAPRAAALVAEMDATLSQSLQQIPYASSAIVLLSYKLDQITSPPDGFGIVVPTIEKRSIVAASFSSLKFPGRAPDDQLLVRVFLGGALAEEQMALSDVELLSIATSEMCELIGARGQPQTMDIVRWHEKMPQYHVGHVQLVERIEQQAAQLSGVELAGNAYHGVGIPQCIESGNRAARRLADAILIAD